MFSVRHVWRAPAWRKSRSDLADVQMGTERVAIIPGWVYHGLIVGTVADAARLLWLLANGRLLQPMTCFGHDASRTLCPISEVPSTLIPLTGWA